MIDFEKMDDKDSVFINKPLSEKEDKAFSEFLKMRRSRTQNIRIRKEAEKLNANEIIQLKCVFPFEKYFV